MSKTEVVILAPELKTEFGCSGNFNQFMAIEGKLFKQATRRQTVYFESGNKGFFIKKHFGVGWTEILKNLLYGKLPVISANNEYRAIARLKQLNIPSLSLAAYGLKGRNPAAIYSFVVTDALDHHISLANYCQEWQHNTPDVLLKWRLIREVARIARTLHENGVNHRDFYLCHLLLDTTTQHAQIKLHVIDLHRVQIRSKTPLRWKVKDLAALYFSAMDIGLTRNDYYRFMKYYNGTETLSHCLMDYADLWSRVAKKAQWIYRKHNRKQ
ncbi:MAG: lipopolysaccharide core heptose(I) kinase RfaP [Gammaproteobacteria bacterium]|nr:lipopolysaccharide core heptose(I) kinase RfaP [Gammaproteobacteria bacterium]